MNRYLKLFGCILLVYGFFVAAARPAAAQPEPASVETPAPTSDSTPSNSLPSEETNPTDAAAPAGEKEPADDAPEAEDTPDASDDATTLQEVEESLPGRKLEPKKDTTERFFLPIGLGLAGSLAVLSVAMFFILKPHY